MQALIISYLVSCISLIALDYLWLWIIMQWHIQKRFWTLMRQPILMWPALAFYILYTVALIFFAVYPARNLWLRYAVGYGAALGFTCYMTYDLTNRATLKSRPVAMVIPDILWGTVVSAIVWAIWYSIYMKLA